MNVLEVDLHKLTVSDPFLGQYQQLVRDVVIPYQWDALNDRIAEAEPSHAIENFRIAAGLQDGEFYGMVFQDSDVAKWRQSPGPCARNLMRNLRKPQMRSSSWWPLRSVKTAISIHTLQ